MRSKPTLPVFSPAGRSSIRLARAGRSSVRGDACHMRRLWRVLHLDRCDGPGATARHYNEQELAALVLAIAGINARNRINAATRQVTGDWVAELIGPGEAAGQAS